MPANVETMFSVRQVPWHGLGKIIQDAPNSEDALVAAGLDWEVSPAQVMVNGRTAKNYIANVRSDNGEVLGIVTDRYKIVQNKEAFSFVDALVASGDVRYETAGSLKNGQRVWMLAKMQESTKILGDEVDQFLVFTNTHDGTGSIRVAITPVRVVCQNTLNLALREAKRTWSTKHMGVNMDEKLQEAARTLEMAHVYAQKLQEQSEMLVDVKVNSIDVKEIISNLLPIGQKASQRQIRNIESKRAVLSNRLLADDIRDFRGTGWGVVNAVTDFVAHTPPDRDTSTYRENLFSAVVGGHPLVDQVVGMLLAA